MSKLFPKFYDVLMSPLERRPRFKQIRKELISLAEGRVLEIGSGTGVNFPLYEKTGCVTAVEPNPEMIKKCQRNLSRSKAQIEVHAIPAEKLPFGDNEFDTAVATLVFCTIPDPALALKEIHRVLKPGGKLLMLEHVKLKSPVYGKIQSALTPMWKQVCDGCHLDRDTPGMIEHSAFITLKVKDYYKGLFMTIEAVKKSF